MSERTRTAIVPENITDPVPGYAPGHWDYPQRCADVEAALTYAEERAAEWSATEDAHGWWHERPHLIALHNEVLKLRGQGDGMSQPDWEARARKALEIASDGAMFDGDHHKMWVIDQMVRALTGCPEITVEATDVNDVAYSYVAQGESEEYLEFLADGDWDEGTPP